MSFAGLGDGMAVRETGRSKVLSIRLVSVLAEARLAESQQELLLRRDRPDGGRKDRYDSENYDVVVELALQR